MQTFLPYADFTKCAESLDDKRLMKQRVETYQILNCLAGESKGWRNHPVTKMWTDHQDWLFEYHIATCKEVDRRGFKDTTLDKFSRLFAKKWGLYFKTERPWWLGHEPLHYSHRGRLYEKNPEWYTTFETYSDYRKKGYLCCEKCNYIWPTHVKK